MGRNTVNHKVCMTLLLSSMLAAPSFAAAPDFVSIDTQVRIGVTDSDSNGAESDILDAELGVKINVTDFVKANFKLELSDGIDDWEDLLEEAYFVIDVDKAGLPVIHAIFDEISVMSCFGHLIGLPNTTLIGVRLGNSP